MRIGVDFGSTYTVLSVFHKDKGNVEALTFSEASPYIPSVVTCGRGRYEFGQAAKTQTGRKGVKTFKGFKMLLSEREEEIWRSRGYSAEETPAEITRIFFDHILKKALFDQQEERIEKLVIGVPEIWNQKLTTIDGRTAIRNICMGLGTVDEVQVVSEPAAASAYFAYHYLQQQGRNYSGKILLIDYGGGTLDITLTDVLSRETDSREDSAAMEIRILERTGAGENETGTLGEAGIVYMEKVMGAAIVTSGLAEDEEELRNNPLFSRAVDDLEAQLQSRTQTVADAYDEFGLDDLSDLDEEDDEFTTIFYRGEEVVITYSLMLRIYKEEIYDVLDKQLRIIMAYMDQHGIDYMDRDKDNFKIVLVGGFCNFCLVKKQVEETFSFAVTDDRRNQGMISSREDREKAISYGTALLANDLIDIRHTAPYSLGVHAVYTNNELCLDYAFRYRQDIECDKAYFPKDLNGEHIPYVVRSGGISRLIINSCEDDKAVRTIRLKPEFESRLKNIIKNPRGTAVIGFSLDNSEVLSIHIREYDFLTKRVSEEDNCIELTRLSELMNED